MSPEEIQQLSKDIAFLIKSNLPSVEPVMHHSQDSVPGIITQLEPFSASTDKPKVAAAEPKLRDLGLMRTKGKKFCTPEHQVEEKRQFNIGGRR